MYGIITTLILFALQREVLKILRCLQLLVFILLIQDWLFLKKYWKKDN